MNVVQPYQVSFLADQDATYEMVRRAQMERGDVTYELLKALRAAESHIAEERTYVTDRGTAERYDSLLKTIGTAISRAERI